jgi:hypothetical protein
MKISGRCRQAKEEIKILEFVCTDSFPFISSRLTKISFSTPTKKQTGKEIWSRWEQISTHRLSECQKD